MSRFKSADERHAKGRTAWAAITVTLWQHSLTPALERLQSVEETVTSFKEAVERARRHEAARLPGGAATISVMSFTTVSNHAAVRQLQSPRRNNASRAASKVVASRAVASGEVTVGASTSVSPALTAPMIGAKKL